MPHIYVQDLVYGIVRSVVCHLVSYKKCMKPGFVKCENPCV